MLFNLFLIFAVLASLVCIGVLIARILGLSCADFGRFRLSLVKPMSLQGDPFTRRDALEILALVLGMICLSYGVSLLYCGIFGNGVSLNEFYYSWRKYDAYHYLKLAELGYADYTENGKPLFLVFFPLYPWLIRLLHGIIPDYQLCGHIISSLCYAGSCVLFGKLVTEEFGHRVGRLSVLFLTAYPFAFFFSSIHTESLFLLLSLASFYCIRRHDWLLAGLLGALAALTRSQGVFLAVVAFAEYWMTEHPVRKLCKKDWKGLWKDFYGKILCMAIVAVGFVIYLILNWRVTGDPFAFSSFQKERWNQGFTLFPNTLTLLKNALVGTPREGYEFVPYTTWGPQLVLFVFCLVFLIYGIRRMPPVYMLYYTICMFLNFSLTNPLSCCRYIACAFPLPIMLAVGSQRRPLLGKILLVFYAVLQGVFMLAYFAGKHIC